MASDNLNQVGKSIRGIKDTADYASNKVFNNKIVERSRDVFDTTVPFEMEFKTHRVTDHIYLDLTFNKPPPRKGCNAECFSNNCQTFIFTDGGDHLINLGVPYIVASPRIFRNRELLDPIYYAETDPDGGLIYVQGSTAPDEITICYVTGDCILDPFDAGQPLHWYQGTMTFGIPTGVGGWGYASFTQDSIDAGATTIYSSNTSGGLFLAGATYIGAMGMIIADTDVGLDMTLDPLVRYPPNGGLVMGAAGVLGFSGTFTVGLQGGGLGHVSVKAQNNAGGSAHTGIATWVFDPIGWSIPSPEAGQQVINDTPIPIGNNIYEVRYPFVLGTLEVTVNGIPVVITEHSNQTFIFAVAPPSGATVIATYIAE